MCLVASAGSFPQSYPTSADTAPLPPAAAALSMSIPPFSQSHPVPSIKREIGRLGIYFGEPHATRASELAPPQFRGTWQPNRPYSPRERGADDADAHAQTADCYLSELEARREASLSVESPLIKSPGCLRCKIEKTGSPRYVDSLCVPKCAYITDG